MLNHFETLPEEIMGEIIASVQPTWNYGQYECPGYYRCMRLVSSHFKRCVDQYCIARSYQQIPHPLECSQDMIHRWFLTEPYFTGIWLKELLDCEDIYHESACLTKIGHRDGKAIYRKNPEVLAEELCDYCCRGTFRPLPSKEFVKYFYSQHPLYHHEDYIRNRMASHRTYYLEYHPDMHRQHVESVEEWKRYEEEHRKEMEAMMKEDDCECEYEHEPMYESFESAHLFHNELTPYYLSWLLEDYPKHD